MGAALAYEPDRSNAHLVFQLRPGAYHDETLIEFNRLGRQRPVVLIWDGLPAHHSGRTRNWIASQRHWPSVEALSALPTTSTH